MPVGAGPDDALEPDRVVIDVGIRIGPLLDSSLVAQQVANSSNNWATGAAAFDVEVNPVP